MHGALGLIDERGEWAVIPPGIDTVDPLVMQAADTRAKALPKHRKGRKVQFDIAMGIGIVFLRVEIGLMIEQAIQDIGRIPFRALNRYRVEGGIVVRNKRIDSIFKFF